MSPSPFPVAWKMEKPKMLAGKAPYQVTAHSFESYHPHDTQNIHNPLAIAQAKYIELLHALIDANRVDIASRVAVAANGLLTGLPTPTGILPTGLLMGLPGGDVSDSRSLVFALLMLALIIVFFRKSGED
ncbi:MAG: hypothetical protein CMA10_04650 [Euryarchaeota archaeon]|nr:hypothetical protein [Euryarchaeota archaeon]|tara:strand:- start:18928 stop:19317 length:390 start_codon:yes stop_codon:yes gene_type:complete